MRRSVVIFCIALAVRVLPWAAGSGASAHVMQSPDCFEYEQAATNLLDHHTLSIAKVAPVEPDTFRTPGYPVFIASVYSVAGRSPHAAVLVQILLAALSCVLLAHWGARLVGERAAFAAALVWALDVGAVANSGILLSECVCLALVMAAYVAWRPGAAGTGAQSGLARAALTGGLLGLAALTRPAVLYWPALVVFAMVCERGRDAWRDLVVLVVAFALPCSAWVARNASAVGLAEFSSLEGQNLLFYRASGAMARVWGVTVDAAWKRLAAEADLELAARGWPRARYGALCKQMAIAHLSAHPLAYVPVLTGGAVKAWTGLAVYDILKHFGYEAKGLGLFEKGLAGIPDRVRALSAVELGALALDLASRLAALFLGLAGLYLLARDRAWTALGVIVPPLVYVTLTAGTVVSYYRFRLPLTPFWSLAAGVALARIPLIRGSGKRML